MNAIHKPYNACEKWGRPLLFLGDTILARIDSEIGLRPHSFELRADRELAVEYLKAAMESLANPDDRAAGLLALRTVVEAYGGLGAVAAEAGISRESLYRALSANGNPSLKTLLAVLKAVGMKLSVEQEQHAAV